MDLDTTARFIQAADLALDEQSLSDLQRQTEGWPAGIALAVLSHDPKDPASMLPQLTGQQREIADYLFDEVLSRQTDRVRRFLLYTSVVDRFSASLCDDLLEARDSSQVLRELEQTNLFLVPLDNHRGWYRYHHLFQEMLVDELERTEPTARQALLSRAGAWHERQGTIEEALAYAQAAGDLDRAGRLILGHWQDFGHRGLTESLRLRLLQSSDADIGSDPCLAIGAGWVFMLFGDAERAERYAVAAARHPLDVASPDGSSSLLSSLANLRSGLGTSGPTQMLADGLLVCALEGPTRSRWLLDGFRAIGTAQLVLGRADEAVVALNEAVLLTENRGTPYVRVFCLGYLAVAHLERRDPVQAGLALGEAEALIDQLGGRDTFQCLPMRTAAVVMAARAAQSSSTRRLVVELSGDLHLATATPWMLADLSTRCAEAALEVGETESAGALLVRARQALSRLPEGGILPARIDRLQERIDLVDVPARENTLLQALTPAERRVLDQLGTHHTQGQIAERLFVSRATVKSHIASIYAKFGVSSRGEALAKLAAQSPDRGIERPSDR
jgi:LuxR family maltose regulon positive regulatory protein